MKRFKKIEGSCAVLALKYVSGLEDSAVLLACKENGFEWGQGMDDQEWGSAAKDLGIKIRAVSMEKCKLGAFLRTYPAGMFILATVNHLMVANNGGIVSHPAAAIPDTRRIIQKAWRVL